MALLSCGRGGLAPQSVTVMLFSHPGSTTGTSLFAIPDRDRRSGSPLIIVWCTRTEAVAVPHIRAASTGCLLLVPVVRNRKT
jgi:hypothetical protein